MNRALNVSLVGRRPRGDWERTVGCEGVASEAAWFAGRWGNRPVACLCVLPRPGELVSLGPRKKLSE